ncbi:hypothetical protein NPIL_85011 [Nephila pilipes]|uniref:Uncharacterized protein n=1 Tax=Nephila pilipes TaxID=299642 RepID=A0A8X6NLK0_NEPPI|nr:hypothetical protein NPIL_85011 [Nephila pilipes]
MARLSALVAIYSSVILVAFSADVTSLSTSEASLIRLATFSSKVATSATVVAGNRDKDLESPQYPPPLPSPPEEQSRAKCPSL